MESIEVPGRRGVRHACVLVCIAADLLERLETSAAVA